MKVKLLIIVSLILLSVTVRAASEIEEWYITKNGHYVVKDSINGEVVSLLGMAKSGEVSIYFQWWSDSCKDRDDKVLFHDPIKINSKLVRFSTYCNGNWQIIFPSSDEGNSYVINQFKRSNFVELKGYDDSYKLLFSAKMTWSN